MTYVYRIYGRFLSNKSEVFILYSTIIIVFSKKKKLRINDACNRVTMIKLEYTSLFSVLNSIYGFNDHFFK